jgi:hypothetical protein
MRKAAVIPALVLALSLAFAGGAKRAEACRGGPCPPWVSAVGYTFAAGLAGGYAYGVGYFVYHDVTDADQSMAYGGGEMIANGAAAGLFGGAAIDALAHDSPGTAAALLPFALMHGTLAVHGGWRLYVERDEFDPPYDAMLWLGGTAFTTNALIWTSQIGERHGRAFGIAEAAVNGPLAVGLGYRAYDRFASWHGGSGFVYAGMTAISAGLTIHGLRTAIAPAPPKLDINNMDLTPTVVSDGISLAPGLGASGTW